MKVATFNQVKSCFSYLDNLHTVSAVWELKSMASSQHRFIVLRMQLNSARVDLGGPRREAEKKWPLYFFAIFHEGLRGDGTRSMFPYLVALFNK